MTYNLKYSLSFRLIFLLIIIGVSSSYAFPESEKHVLYINSYHPAFPTFIDQFNSVKQTLDQSALVDVEYMDSKRFNDSTNLKLFHEYLSYKLSRRTHYDAIIVSDDAALKYALSHKDTLFKNIPIVFFGINNVKLALQQNNDKQVTGVVEHLSIKETLDCMVKLFPSTKKLYTISDGTLSGIADEETANSYFSLFRDVDFINISLANISFDEFAKQLKSIPSDAPVLLLSAYEDKNHNTLSFNESLSLIKENTNAPIFHLWNHGMGNGIIGGKIISQSEQATAAAEIVKKILNGEDPSSNPIVYESLNSFIFDYKELAKHNISLSQLPDKSYVMNKPISFYEANKKIILIFIITVIVLTISILLLLRNIAKRRSTAKLIINQNNELRKSIAKANEAESKFRIITDQSAAGIVIVNNKGNITFANELMCVMSGYTKEELNTIYLSDLVRDDMRSSIMLDEISEEDIVKRMICVRKNRTEYIAEIIAHTAEIENETIYICTIRDITLIEQDNEELKKAKDKAEESNNLKMEFIHNMSHEIRTPMNGIIGFAGLLREVSVSKEELDEYLNIILNSANQLLRIIDDILEISRLETKQVKVITSEIFLNSLIDEQYRIFLSRAKADAPQLFMKNEIPDEQSVITTDPSKLIKIISNLIDNAYKYTSKGSITVGSFIVGDEVEIYVEDTGIGISESNMKQIFDRFSRGGKELSTKFDGLGLGLSIARENTVLIGGTIHVKSELGKGSRFYIRLPYRKQVLDNNSDINDITDDDSEALTSISNTNPVFLIAEDNDTNYMYLKILLNKLVPRNTTIRAYNGKEAVKFLAKENKITMVFMDIKMPTMNGIDATIEIRKFNPSIIIIAQTAYTTADDHTEMLNAGANGYIEKPIEKHFLIDILNKYL